MSLLVYVDDGYYIRNTEHCYSFFGQDLIKSEMRTCNRMKMKKWLEAFVYCSLNNVTISSLNQGNAI